MMGLPELTKRNPTDDELLTLFQEAEYIMNTRPLNRSISSENMSPLRPIDIMVGVIPPRDQDQLMHKSSPGDEIKRGYKYTQRIVDKWWEQWLREYTRLLQTRSKWTAVHRDLKVGDFVLVPDEPNPGRCNYPYGRITDVKVDKYGHVRSTKAKLFDGRIKERDIRKFVLLEESNY